MAEQMAAACHNSVTASLPYQGRSVQSECNRLNALIGKGKNRKSTYIQMLMDEDSSCDENSVITDNETLKSEVSDDLMKSTKKSCCCC